MKRIHTGMPAALALAAALAGCVTAPTADNPRTPWTPAASDQVHAGDAIWKTLRQQTNDWARPQTLGELTDLALSRNPATRKAWQDARAAAARVDWAQGAFMPAVTVSGSGARIGTSTSPHDKGTQSWNYGPALQVNYLVINLGGGRAAAVEEALQTVYAANETFNQAIQDVLQNVATAYYGLISAQANTTAAVASVADARKALDAAQARLNAGVGTELDVLQAQASFDQAQYNEAAVEGQLQTARGALALAVNLPADLAVVPAPPSDAGLTSLGTTDVRRMIDAAIGARPDIAALRANLAAMQAAIKVAHAASWPNLYLNGNVSQDNNIWKAGTPTAPDHQWSYGTGVSVQWNVFDGWQTESNIRIAEAQAESARALLEQAELAASADVWVRFHAYETALRKETFSAASLASAEKAQRTVLAAYQSGLRSILDVLTAEALLATARSQQVAARQETFTALINLAHASGLLQTGGTASNSALLSTLRSKDSRP